MTDLKFVNEAFPGRYSTQAVEFAKLTAASITPSCAFNILSTLIAHDAQLSPVTGKFFLTEVSMSLFFCQS
jgi:hypothetical protein